LERAQLVRRERNRHDRRTVRVDITDQGRHQLERALLLVGNLLNQISAPFSRSEHEMLITLLRRLVQGL
jgi:DNA-binding MarR family transcriptional regulator